MRLLVYIGCLLQVSFISCVSIAQRHLPNLLHKRSSDLHNSNEAISIGCIQMESEPGQLMYVSPGSSEVCGLYLIGLSDQLVEITFHEFDIDCENGGLLALVDGWEAQGEFYPAELDHPRPMDARYTTYCGKQKPPKRVLASQNVAMLQYRIPANSQGFRVSIDFPHNSRPCNVISLLEEGTYTLRNYGQRSNCTLSLLHPERVEFLAVDVGQNVARHLTTREPGVVPKCAKRNRHDYVEVMEGSGLDPSLMWKKPDFCGASSSPQDLTFDLGCPHSVIRLVSSGQFYNSVTFDFRPLHENELELATNDQC